MYYDNSTIAKILEIAFKIFKINQNVEIDDEHINTSDNICCAFEILVVVSLCIIGLITSLISEDFDDTFYINLIISFIIVFSLILTILVFRNDEIVIYSPIVVEIILSIILLYLVINTLSYRNAKDILLRTWSLHLLSIFVILRPINICMFVIYYLRRTCIKNRLLELLNSN